MVFTGTIPAIQHRHAGRSASRPVPAFVHLHDGIERFPVFRFPRPCSRQRSCDRIRSQYLNPDFPPYPMLRDPAAVIANRIRIRR
jgi:hypothetical protein